MKKEDWEAALKYPTKDGRKYQKIKDVEDLFEYKNCLVKAKRDCGYNTFKYLAGGILHHVDPALVYLYIRIPGTEKTFPLPIGECEFWVLAPHEEEEIAVYQEMLKVIKEAAE